MCGLTLIMKEVKCYMKMKLNKLQQDATNVLKILKETKGIIYTFGNGGSSSIANHMACDWMLGTEGEFVVFSLASNNSLLSAIANDKGYKSTCTAQICNFIEKVDVLVLISSSGFSPNIIAAATNARIYGAYVIGFTGAAGDKKATHLSNICNLSVHIESNDYGEIEDYHSNVMHEVLRQWKKDRH